jgi:thymidylate synthase ThyX
MEIIVKQITDRNLMSLAMSYTSNSDVSITDENYKKQLIAKHSPIRTQMYTIEMRGIPSFVSVHFVRHKIGVEHFVQSMRTDRKNVSEVSDRNTPVNHLMFCNAESIMNMSYKRLCNCASKETRDVMKEILYKIDEFDPILASQLMPTCFYRGGYCPEPKCCGWNKHFNENYSFLDILKNI